MGVDLVAASTVHTNKHAAVREILDGHWAAVVQQEHHTVGQVAK